MENETLKIDRSLLDDAKQIIDKGRNAAYGAVNTAMISTYWYLGKRIVEEEQRGQQRAEYGKRLISMLSEELTREYGKGFSPRTLAYYRRFYLAFPDPEILHTRVQNLTWSHIRELIRVNDPQARNWYMKEASDQGWSVRTLSRNISTQYYERLLLSQNKDPVEGEMKRLTAPYQADKLEFIKNPVVAEFLGLESNAVLLFSSEPNRLIQSTAPTRPMSCNPTERKCAAASRTAAPRIGAREFFGIWTPFRQSRSGIVLSMISHIHSVERAGQVVRIEPWKT